MLCRSVNLLPGTSCRLKRLPLRGDGGPSGAASSIQAASRWKMRTGVVFTRTSCTSCACSTQEAVFVLEFDELNSTAGEFCPGALWQVQLVEYGSLEQHLHEGLLLRHTHVGGCQAPVREEAGVSHVWRLVMGGDEVEDKHHRPGAAHPCRLVDFDK